MEIEKMLLQSLKETGSASFRANLRYVEMLASFRKIPSPRELGDLLGGKPVICQKEHDGGDVVFRYTAI